MSSRNKKKSLIVRFNINIDIDKVRQYFINRAITQLEFILPDMDKIRSMSDTERHYLRRAAYAVGRVYDPACNLKSIVDGDFWNTIRVLESVYKYAVELKNPDKANEIQALINRLLEDSDIDLGIIWRGGEFRPSGAVLLDEELVNKNLQWLADKKYDTVLEPFNKGLRHLLESNKNPTLLSDVITDVYESLESMAKIVVGNDRELSGNKNSFIKALDLNENYKRMFSEYIDYGCQYRHAAKKGTIKQLPKPNEVEAFLYMTGLFLRLSIQQLKEDS
ncbi:hypothetical protein ES707_19370 [subsurface metagenome]